ERDALITIGRRAGMRLAGWERLFLVSLKPGSCGLPPRLPRIHRVSTWWSLQRRLDPGRQGDTSFVDDAPLRARRRDQYDTALSGRQKRGQRVNGHRLSVRRGRERSVHLPVRIRRTVLSQREANRANAEGHVKR